MKPHRKTFQRTINYYSSKQHVCIGKVDHLIDLDIRDFTFHFRLVGYPLSCMKFLFRWHLAKQTSRACSPMEVWYCVAFNSMLLDTRHGKTISSHCCDFQTFKSKDILPSQIDVHYCIELQKSKPFVRFLEKIWWSFVFISRESTKAAADPVKEGGVGIRFHLWPPDLELEAWCTFKSSAFYIWVSILNFSKIIWFLFSVFPKYLKITV